MISTRLGSVEKIAPSPEKSWLAKCPAALRRCASHQRRRNLPVNAYVMLAAFREGKTMPNVPSSWLDFNPANIEGLKRIYEMKRTRAEGLKTLEPLVGWKMSSISEWINDKGLVPKESVYFKLLQYAAERGWIPAEQYDRAFFGISSFLGYPGQLLIDRHKDIVGDYAVYRYSMLAPGHILRGALNIKLEEGTLKTSERHRIQGDIYTRVEGEEERSVANKSQVDDFFYDREGFFFATDTNSYVMISKKWDDPPVQVQTVYFDNVHGGSGHGADPGQAGPHVRHPMRLARQAVLCHAHLGASQFATAIGGGNPHLGAGEGESLHPRAS
jgi:hypothetical protein